MPTNRNSLHLRHFIIPWPLGRISLRIPEFLHGQILHQKVSTRQENREFPKTPTQNQNQTLDESIKIKVIM